MSRLIAKLTQIGKGIPKPMGFTVAQSPVKGRMALVASIAESDGLSTLKIDGADAVLLHPAALPPRTLPRAVKALADVPWGLWLVAETDIAALTEAGADYAVFTLESHVVALNSANKLGKVLKVDSSLPDSALRVLGELPVDALLIADEKLSTRPLSLEQMLLLQRFISVWNKPTLALMPSDLSADEIRALWLSGIDGLVVEPGRDRLGERLTALSGIMDEMGLPPRKKSRTEALVPYAPPKTEPPEEEEEEDEP